MRSLSDEAVLAGLSSGDPGAAAAFVDRFQRRVFGMTLSVLRDRQAAEEAAQEAFVRAWRHASTYDPRNGSVAGWLLMIARNVSINLLPSHRSYPVDPEVLPGLQDPGPSQGRDGQLAPPSWLFATVHLPNTGAERFDVQLVTRDGRHLSAGTAVLGGTQDSWGTQIPIDLTNLAQLRFVAADGQAAIVANLNARAPWGPG
jgi:DNA-directed RNA polymerase specialized sigma24 family protein